MVESSATLSGASHTLGSADKDKENYCVLIDEGGELILSGKILDTDKKDTSVKNYGGFLMKPGSVVDGTVCNNSGKGFYVYGGTALGDFTNYGKVTVEDHYDGYLYLFQGGNCTPPAQFRAAGCLLMAYFPQQPSWAHRGWGLQSQPLGVNWAAGKGMRLKSSQGSSAQPGESQHSLVGML